MTRDGRDDMILLLRSTTPSGLPRPTAEFRRRAWDVFTAALDRRLAARRGLRQVGKRP
jgi:hypothetical protein